MEKNGIGYILYNKEKITKHMEYGRMINLKLQMKNFYLFRIGNKKFSYTDYNYVNDFWLNQGWWNNQV